MRRSRSVVPGGRARARRGRRTAGRPGGERDGAARADRHAGARRAGRRPVRLRRLGKSKEPITVISDKLEYDYKDNIVVYRGAVEVTQGDVKMVSDVAHHHAREQQAGRQAGGQADDRHPPAARAAGAGSAAVERHGAACRRSWRPATCASTRARAGRSGGRAVFDQAQRTLVLTENPGPARRPERGRRRSRHRSSSTRTAASSRAARSA